MSRLSRAREWIGRLTLGRPLEREFDEELQFHLDEETDHGVQAGLTREAAERAARRSLGGPAGLVKEECRDAWGLVMLGDLRRDLALGGRLLRRGPVFTGIALVTLTIAIGATVTVFSLVDAWLLKPLAFPDANRLVVGLAATRERPTDPAVFLLYRDFLAWRDRAHAFDRIAAAFRRSYLVNTGSDASDAIGLAVTPEFFETFEVPALLGRTLSEQDSTGPPRVVLSYGIWQRLFGGTPSVLGRNVSLNGTAHEVVGVMPRSFDVRLLDQSRGFELWTLLEQDSTSYSPTGTGPVAVIGRLRGDMTLTAATNDVEPIQQDVEGRFTEGIGRFVVLLTPLASDNARTVRTTLVVMAAASGCVLLIAALNVGTLLVGRGLTRHREAAIRAAVGCGRARLVRQFLTETLLLSACGGAGALLFALVAIRLFVSWNPVGSLPPHAPQIDWRVMTFTLLAVTIVTVVAGLLPAWRVSRLEVASALRSGDGRGATAAGSRLQMTLVAVQAAIALVLAVTTVLLGRTFAQLQNTPLGFTANNLTVISLALPIDEFATGPERVSAFERLAARLATSAIGVAASTSPPLSSGAPVSVRPGASSIGTPLRISAQDVTVNFFETLRIRLVSGRSFDDRDRTDGAPVGILNEAAARLLFGDAADVVGRQIQIGNQQSREIVGVVANTQSAFYNSLEWRTDPIVFLPASQAFSALRDPTVRSFGLHLLIRTNRTVTMAEIKPVVASISNRIAVTAVTTAAAAVGEATRQPAFRMMLLGWFGAASLLLAAIGVYGVVAQLVAARRREIGIRLALGAGLPLLMRSLVSRVVTVGLIGTAGGALFIVSMRRSLAAVLYGVQPLDPRSFAVGVAVLLVLVAIAALVPALRIIAVKPTEALRAD